MIINEVIFILSTVTISLTALAALRFGREALVAFTCTVCILANLFVLKQITLFGLSATCSDAFTIGATLGLNLLQEYYGKSIARKTIWINFFLLVFYALIGQISLSYIPSVADTSQEHFVSLLYFAPRIVSASLSVFLISQSIDYLLYGLLKKVCHNRFLIARNYGSMLVSQLVDTVLFSFLGLYGIIANIGQIIIISYLIKVAAIIIASPFIGLSRKLVKN
ncbi:MAG: queuosine precursor transporter [bacterium]|nr:queuosine precursor transporter [bacterium]